MANLPDSDIYPTITYIDPLVMPQFIQTNNWFSIRNQLNGDWLLSAFIHKLDMEVVDDVEEWKEHKETVAAIFDACRTYGWCVFQAYSDEDKVFTPHEFESWITEKNPTTGKLERVGIRVKWTDDLKNTFTDALYFADTELAPSEAETIEIEEADAETEHDDGITITKDSRQTNPNVIGGAELFIWRKGNGQPLMNCPADSSMVIPDLDLSVLSIAIQIRQIQNTLTFSATNPYFYHLKYGDAINPAQRKNLLKQMGYVNTSKGIGAKESILKEIVAVENGSIEKCIAALDELLSFYASTTRLPLSFYFGEKQVSSGLDSGGAEDADDDRIMKKKEYILQHFADQLTDIALTYWGIQLPDLYGFYAAQKEAKEQEKKAFEEKKLAAMSNGGLESDEE